MWPGSGPKVSLSLGRAVTHTDLAIDDGLIEQAQKLGIHKTKKATVNAALDEYIWRKQAGLLRLFGAIDYDPAYDYKRERRKKRT